MSNNSLQIASFSQPVETRHQSHGEVAVVQFGSQQVHRAEFQPGWSWKEDVQPKAGTPSCEVRHLMLVLAGKMEITMDTGEMSVIGPGDVAVVAPGHQAKIIGDETFVTIDVPGLHSFVQTR